MMKVLLTAILLVLLLASPALAAKQTYTMTYDGTFHITRALVDTDVAWVAIRCNEYSRDYPVIWGTTASLTGFVNPDFFDGTNCSAYLTITPWRIHPKDIVISL